MDFTFNFSGNCESEGVKCGILKLKIPNQNYGPSWNNQSFFIQVTNLQDNTTSSNQQFIVGNNPTLKYFKNYFNDYNLNQGTLNNETGHFFHGKLVADQGSHSIEGEPFDPFYLNDTDVLLYFSNEGSFDINQGVETTMKYVKATACSDWEGIVVNSMGVLIADEIEINKANIGIKVNNGGLSINKSKIYNSGTGLNLLNSTTNLIKMDENVFEDLEIGVQLNNTQNIRLTPSDKLKINKFKNCEKGVFSWLTTNTECMFNRFENIGDANYPTASEAAIVSVNSSMTIAKNEILNSSIGISSNSDKLFTVEDNDFNNTQLGLRMEKNRQGMFVKNNTITGKDGIWQIMGRSPYIQNNQINNAGGSSVIAYGVRADFTRSPLIEGNFVYSSNAIGGILLNNSNDSKISSNIVSLLTQNDRHTAIEVNGGDNNKIADNSVDAITQTSFTEAFGIRAAGGSNSEITCNDIHEIEEGTIAEEGQFDIYLTTNNYFDNRTGVRLSNSVIGEQVHTGNLFRGPFADRDINGIGLLVPQVQYNKFKLNDNVSALHIPTVFSPSDIVQIDPNGNAPTCNTNVYTISKRDRLIALCDYINAIRNNTTMDPVRKKNLLAFYYRLLAKYFPEVNKPYCVGQFLDAYQGTNVEKIASIRKKIDEMNNISQVPSNLIENYGSALDAYLLAIDSNFNISENKAAYDAAFNQLAATYADYTNVETQLLNEIESELLQMIPIDDYDISFKDFYSLWVERYNEAELSPAQKLKLQELASLCPDDYGDLVYGARSLAAEYDETRYDLLQCLDLSERNRMKQTNIKQFVISPNPAQNEIHISAGSTISKVIVYDLTGRPVIVKKAESSEERINISDLPTGFYNLECYTLLGNSLQNFIKTY